MQDNVWQNEQSQTPETDTPPQNAAAGEGTTQRKRSLLRDVSLLPEREWTLSRIESSIGSIA